MLSKFKSVLGNLGPGLLYAGAAVGVSHLVMSTKAGASYGYLLLFLIPLVHVIKYPFYRFGPEYTAVTGKNILHGYNALGKWAIYTYMAMTLITMCLIQAAVTIVTSSIAVKFFKLDIPAEMMPHIPAIAFLVIAAVVLSIGQYSILDKMMKVIILILTVTTIIAVASVLLKTPGGVYDAEASFDLNKFVGGKYVDAMFLAAFLGWMPAPMDISVWHSVWSEEANTANGKKAPLKRAMLDFNIGFYGTACLAMCFLALGALVMFGGPEAPSPKGAVFAGQLIEMYTSALGSWAYPMIGIAALTTMFSTTLTCLDAYPRTLQKCFTLLKSEKTGEEDPATSKKYYQIVLWIAVALTIVVFILTKKIDGAMGVVVMIATVVSFVAAPIFAILNYLTMKGKTIPEENKPGPIMKVWCLFGIVLLFVSSIMYLYIGFFKAPPEGYEEPTPAAKAVIEKTIENAPKN
ncbi:MAG: divalent metal cation transporter [Lentisphaeraceae bacterium]|nr:divalent metal cation transporter [Lentisphaeraceae bacterium]